jgi:4-hydroxybenzoate polyprenyltransferase
MRPKQWTKNLLLFAGLLFTGRYFDPAFAWRALVGFAVFCLLSGAIYLLNDIRDAEQDRRHPRKRLRPIASGQLRPAVAGVWAAGLTVVALACSLWLGWTFYVVAVCYLALNVLYSFGLKHVVVLDVFCIALGFVLRALAGVEAIRHYDPLVELTDWFLLCAFFLALFLALCKRRHEALLLDNGGSSHRKVLDEYTPALLDQMVAVATTSTILTYALWATVGKFKDHHVVYTLPFVVFGVFRYLYIVYKRQEGGEPEQVLLGDAPLLANIVLWLVTTLILL